MSNMSDTDNQNERLINLESRFAFQQEAIESLSDVVAKQWDEIEMLKKRIKALDDQLYELEVDNKPGSKETPPPHY